MKRLIEAIILASGNVLAVTVFKTLDGKSYDIAIAGILSAVSAICFIKITEYLLLEWPLRVRFFRIRLDPKAAVEGLWLEQVPKLATHPHTLISIAYNPHSKEYRVHGINFSENAELIRTFDSVSSTVIPTLDQLIYTYEADQAREGLPDAVGICYMTFHRGNSEKYDHGTGYFFNRDNVSEKHDFTFRRVKQKKNESIEELVGRHISKTTDSDVKKSSIRSSKETTK